MPHTAGEWTVAMLAGMPDDGRRYEVVDGDLLVTPAPSLRHQRAVGVLYRLLASHVEGNGLGEALLSPADIELDPRTLVQPDLFVVPLVDGRRLGNWSDIGGRLRLAIEILSPSTARADRHLKRRRYQRAGIAEYWIVDLDARLIERWKPDDERPEILAGTLVWQPEPGVAELQVDLPALFREIADDEVDT